MNLTVVQETSVQINTDNSYNAVVKIFDQFPVCYLVTQTRKYEFNGEIFNDAMIQLYKNNKLYSETNVNNFYDIFEYKNTKLTYHSKVGDECLSTLSQTDQDNQFIFVDCAFFNKIKPKCKALRVFSQLQSQFIIYQNESKKICVMRYDNRVELLYDFEVVGSDQDDVFIDAFFNYDTNCIYFLFYSSSNLELKPIVFEWFFSLNESFKTCKCAKKILYNCYMKINYFWQDDIFVFYNYTNEMQIVDSSFCKINFSIKFSTNFFVAPFKLIRNFVYVLCYDAKNEYEWNLKCLDVSKKKMIDLKKKVTFLDGKVIDIFSTLSSGNECLNILYAEKCNTNCEICKQNFYENELGSYFECCVENTSAMHFLHQTCLKTYFMKCKQSLCIYCKKPIKFKLGYPLKNTINLRQLDLSWNIKVDEDEYSVLHNSDLDDKLYYLKKNLTTPTNDLVDYYNERDATIGAN